MQKVSVKKRITRGIRSTMFCISFIVYLILCVVLIPLCYLIYLILRIFTGSPTWYQRLVGTAWVNATHALIGMLTGSNTTMVKDKRIDDPKNIRSIGISNHVTYFDWLYCWVGLQRSPIRLVIFIAKQEIENIPILGYGFKMVRTILIQRSSSKSPNSSISRAVEFLRRQLELLIKQVPSFCLFLYPEGTFIDRGTKENDKLFYAIQRELRYREDVRCKLPEGNMVYPKNTILPRVNGFVEAIRTMGDKITNIVGTTIYVHTPRGVYPCEEYSLSNLLRGHSGDMNTLVVMEHINMTKKILDSPVRFIVKHFEIKDKQLDRIDKIVREKGVSLNGISKEDIYALAHNPHCFTEETVREEKERIAPMKEKLKMLRLHGKVEEKKKLKDLRDNARKELEEDKKVLSKMQEEEDGELKEAERAYKDAEREYKEERAEKVKIGKIKENDEETILISWAYARFLTAQRLLSNLKKKINISLEDVESLVKESEEKVTHLETQIKTEREEKVPKLLEKEKEKERVTEQLLPPMGYTIIMLVGFIFLIWAIQLGVFKVFHLILGYVSSWILKDIVVRV
ncbi:hypothetical protein NEFER03_1630 [Nematocida sp. LUAm3]|nr:hypothetical protein NEFER03_1630 [Nematocida sp. LUAm3]KAI5176110.1 hypothetical protein NEFER02_1931 [Nematocida sp. LUAm2]KAI5178998.1 hypothetical protein NEFER01_1874 [Nematocida sp. LUAm1]